MTATPSLNNNLNRSIGAPPKQLAIIAYVSFIAIIAFFYYVLFIFRFEYQYTGKVSVNRDNLNEYVINVHNAFNLSPKRLRNWKINVKILNPKLNSETSLTIGKEVLVKKNALFYNKKDIFPIWSNNSVCIIKLTSITFYDRLFDSK